MNLPHAPGDVVEVYAMLGHLIEDSIRTNLQGYYQAKYINWDWAVYLHKICKPKNLKDFCLFLERYVCHSRI